MELRREQLEKLRIATKPYLKSEPPFWGKQEAFAEFVFSWCKFNSTQQV